ncbi:hypothetical protein LEMLEM_LOCUS4389 [Lemmus lemmus]
MSLLVQEQGSVLSSDLSHFLRLPANKTSHHAESCHCCNRRSCGCGSCSRSPDFHGLHGIRNSSSIHSSQDDVSICNRQWRRSCSRKPGGHTSVSGGPWTFYINERDPG